VAGIVAVLAVWLWFDRRRLQLRLAEIEAERLRRWFDPQFLRSTLKAVAALGYSDPKKADQVLTELNAMFDESRESEVALREERAFLMRYLALQKLLLGDRLQYHLSFDGDVLGAAVPSMIIQPLAENALTHGISKDGVARLIVRAMRGGDNLIVVVVDAGPGLRSGLEQGDGLANIRARLAYLYGSTARLKLLEPPDGGLMAQMVIPFRSTSREWDKAHS
jgi:sensor histidine kinase YesM